MPPILKKRKRSQAKETNFEELTWSKVDLFKDGFVDIGDDEMGGIYSFEEIDGVDCEWEDLPVGKYLKVKTDKKVQKKPQKKVEEEELNELEGFIDLDASLSSDETPALPNAPESLSETDEDDYNSEGSEEEHDDDDEEEVNDSNSEHENEREQEGEGEGEGEEEEEEVTGMEAWKESHKVHGLILKALKNHSFTKPTEIQAAVLPLAMKGKHILGAAETGSGKTLAFGIPIIDWLVRFKTRSTGLTALIITPTRELAVQVRDHLGQITRFIPSIKMMTMVGGLAIQKQERQFSKNPHIIIATPGRLWEFITSKNQQFEEIFKHQLRYLVMDEADRLMEKGHFKELDSLISLIKACKKPKQILVFSATLGGSNLKLSSKPTLAKVKNSLDVLMQKLDLDVKQDKNVCLVDLTMNRTALDHQHQPSANKQAVAKGVKECRLECLKQEKVKSFHQLMIEQAKDYFLYYFLFKYPGRTLVFVNSKDAARRLLPLLKNLQFDQVYGLHADMQQRQRLKNIDRFRQNKKVILIATDVAARGLDIPLVDHVIHYQVPRSSEVIQTSWSGRTGRAGQEGISLLFCSPEETNDYKKLCKSMQKDDLSTFPIDLHLLSLLKQRVKVAQELDSLEHSINKQKHEEQWVKKNSDLLELDVSTTTSSSRSKNKKHGGDGGGGGGGNERVRQKIQGLRTRLNQMLGETSTLPRGFSAKYLSGEIAEKLLAAEAIAATANAHKREDALSLLSKGTTALERISFKSKKNKKK